MLNTHLQFYFAFVTIKDNGQGITVTDVPKYSFKYKRSLNTYEYISIRQTLQTYPLVAVTPEKVLGTPAYKDNEETLVWI